MTRNCKYPACKSPATHTWALVPVCWRHHEVIRVEAIRYYMTNGKIRRIVYGRIRHLTPWGGARKK